MWPTKIFVYIITLLLFACSSACLKSNQFEKNISLPSHKWPSKFKPTYSFEISDIVSNYYLSLMLRHTDAYPYSNLWLNVNMKLPEATEYTKQQIEIPLAQADGKWLARDFNEIIEHKMPLNQNGAALHFTKAGHYEIQLEQIMRKDPLPEIMSVGIRLEKIQ